MVGALIRVKTDEGAEYSYRRLLPGYNSRAPGW